MRQTLRNHFQGAPAGPELEYAFYVIGIGGAALLALFGVWAVRSPSFTRSG